MINSTREGTMTIVLTAVSLGSSTVLGTHIIGINSYLLNE